MTHTVVVGISRFRFGVVTALPKEFAAMRSMLEDPLPVDLPGDPSRYVCGSIPAVDGSGSHGVVLTMLKLPGNNSAAATVSHLLRSFPHVNQILMVGIAGGVPQQADADKHVRLGDVVVSNEYGVFQWDAMKLSRGKVEYRGLTVPPSALLLGAAKLLEANRVAGSYPWEAYLVRGAALERSTRPAEESDRLFDSLNPAVEIPHPKDAVRREGQPRIHLSRIGSGNSVLKDPAVRDRLRDECGIRAIEMEGSGVAEGTWNAGQGYIVIRGICDYCDSHKNDEWQGYAAVAPAAYARALIESIPLTLDPAWRVLADDSQRSLEAILDTIDAERLPRTDVLEACREATLLARAVALIGSSGSGKSAIAKRLAQEPQARRPAFFLRADELATLESRLATGFGHSIASLLRDQPAESALMVLDGVDRLGGHSDYQHVAALVGALALSSPASPWRLLVTCETKSWARVLDGLRDRGVDLRATPVTCAPLTEKERRMVGAATPSLQPLLSRDDLEPLTSNLKMLDILARGAAEVGLAGSAAWVSESSLIEWFWERVVQGHGRSVLHARVLERLATQHADLGVSAVAITDLSDAEALLVPELERLALVAQWDGAARLTHDVIGDYARQRFLLARLAAHAPDDVQRRLTSPVWHAAISLVALHFLEARESTEERSAIEGLRALAKLIGGDGSPGLSQDLTLDAVCRSIRVHSLLERYRSELLADGGELLRRFLRRFLVTGTAPHPGLERIRMDLSPSQRAAVEARFRSPDGYSWVPVIRWIVQHGDDVLASAPVECLRVAELWFGAAKTAGIDRLSVPAGADLGRLVITFAERTADLGRSYRRASDTSLDAAMSSRLYALALECAPDDTDRLRTVVRRLAGRDPPSAEVEPSGIRVFGRTSRVLQDPRETVGPWPHGPKSSPDRSFRDVALSQEGARALVRTDVSLAAECFLSLLIKPGREEYDFQAIEDLEGECELERVDAATPPFRDFAPARALFEADASVGIEFCTTLINFATERWAEGRRRAGTGWYDSAAPEAAVFRRRNDVPVIRLHVGGVEKLFRGDAAVFRWRSGIWGPHVASAVLMTLEGWLYDAADTGSLDHAWLERLLSTGTSSAMLGLLLDVALRHPPLLSGPLEPLVGADALYYLSRLREVEERPDTALMWWRGPQRSIPRQQAVDWHTMPHRRTAFEAVVMRALVGRGLSWPVLEEARQRWIARRAASRAEQVSPILGQLIAEFDPSNFRVRADGVEFVPPGDLLTTTDEEQHARDDVMSALVFGIRCRQLLDQDIELSATDIEALFSSAERLISVDKTDVPIAVPAEQLRCAAAAVAVLKGRSAIAARPDLLVRSREILLAACFHPPAPEPLDTRANLSDEAWDHFCALGVSSLMDEYPHDSALERAMGSLLLAPHDETVALVMRRAANVRRENPRLIRRLLHVAVLVARLLYVEARARDGEGSARATRRRRQLKQRFDQGRIGPLPAAWLDLASVGGPAFEPFPWSIWEELTTLFSARNRSAVPTTGFDGRYLLAAFQWLPDASAERAARDRDFLLGLVEDLHTLIRRRTDGEVQRLQEQCVGGISSEFLGMTADAAAAFVMSEERPDVRRRVWIAWLRVPVPAAPGLEEAYKRAEMFLESFYRIALDRGEPPQGFTTALTEIFEFALSTDGPIRHHEPRFFSRELAKALLGTRSRFGSSHARWTAARAGVAKVLSGCWERWAAVALEWHGCGEQLLDLLGTAAAEDIRRQALLWLSETPDQSWLGDERCSLPLTVFLESVAGQFTSGGSKPPEEIAFRKLLAPLLEAQFERALLLAKRIGDRGWS